MGGVWLATVCTGLLVAVGVVGAVVPVAPGPLLVLVAMVVHGLLTGWDGWATAVVALGAALVVVDGIVGIRIPARATARGAGRRALAAGAVGGVVGFFAVPVVGLPLGWLVGVFLVEVARADARSAWRATLRTLRAFGVATLVQAAIALAMAMVWGAWAVAILAR